MSESSYYNICLRTPIEDSKTRQRDRDEDKDVTSGGQLNTTLSLSSQWTYNLGSTQFPLKFFWSFLLSPNLFSVPPEIHLHREHVHKDGRTKAASTLQRSMKRFRKEEGVEEIENRTFSTAYFFLHYLQRSSLSEMFFSQLWTLLKQARVIWFCDECKKIWRNAIHRWTSGAFNSCEQKSKNVQNNAIKWQMRNR